MSSNKDERKLFVGGLSWDTTEADMKEYFSKYGAVSECTLKTDPNTGRSRGFGFVLFEDAASVDATLVDTTHSLNGKNIDPKRAVARGALGGGDSGAIKKVFVGGVDPNTSEATLRSHFEQFGAIEEIALPFDKVKGTRKGFVFITFQSAETVDKVVQDTKQSLDGKMVEIKKATPKDQRGGGGRGGFGGRGGRGGGFGQYGGRGGGGGYGGGGYGDYNQGGWGGYQGGYGGGDYNGYYNGYENTDYSGGYGGYNQGYNQGSYGGYNQGSYGGYNQGNYGSSYSGDGYSGGKQKQEGNNYGYHPYQR